MSSALLPAGLVPFEDLFSTPPNPMLGPGSPPTGPAAERPDLEGSEPAEDPACSPPSPEGPGVPPCWDFGDLFGRPPNPMLSPCEAPASPSPRAAPGASEGQLRPEAASLAGGPAGEVGPRKGGGGPRPDAKKSQGKPQDEDFAHLLEQYRRDRRAPSPAPAAPPAPKGVAKRGASTAGGRAKKRKRKGPARAPAPPAAQERPPVSQEFVHRNTVALGGQRVCKYFLAGRCLHGEQCRLDHRADGLKFQQLCKFYVQGYCTRAEHCRYLHHEFPCKFFHTGAKCYQGDRCGFSHAPLTPDTQSLLKAALAGPAAPPPDPAPASS